MKNIVNKLGNFLKEDWKKTQEGFSDVYILVKRALGFSFYGLKKQGGEMTSRELKEFNWDSTALWFDSKEEFRIYAMQNYWPLGRCKIGFGKEVVRK